MTVEELKAQLKQHQNNGTPAAAVLKMLDDLNADPNDVPFHRYVHQQRALWQSKFGEEPAVVRHPAALEHLRKHLDLDRTTDRETLGIAGGICKRMWLDEGQRLHLDRALAFYLRGYRSLDPGDDFYTAINAAYFEELLAEQELLAGFDPDVVSDRYTRAAGIAQAIIDAQKSGAFKPQDWWHYATVADAHLGLGDSKSAAEWMKNGLDKFNPPDSDRITTLRQSAHLIQLQAKRRGEQWSADAQNDLAAAFGIELDAMRGAIIGKVGVALSGGGFRASLFHIGVLARLAELDLLRHVEVLSCVSGGSIIGAQYYLELRHLLETKGSLTRDDYIAAVHNLETKFLAGVQKNIRTRVATNLLPNLKMIFSRDYSRTERLAELYDEHLFARTPATLPLYLNDLKIAPKDGGTNFDPRAHNWKRSSKVPVLILNATTLNTGHQWQFTAAEMGEPPYTRHQLDTVEILPRRAYDEKMRLSRAVAASAGVPGLFAPLTIHRDGRTIRLVDGGVHDNQGVASLLEQDCKTILVSDASGQLAPQTVGSAGVAGPPMRANSILQARLREAQIVDLFSRRRAGVLQGAAFVHMTQELAVRPDLQKMLAEMRTDLDSFSDAEGYALMTMGYLMISGELPKEGKAPGLAAMASNAKPYEWDFLRVRGALDGSDAKASERLFDMLSATGSARRKPPLLKWPALLVLIPVLLLLSPLIGLLAVILYRRKGVDEAFLSILIATSGWIASNLYLWRYENRERERGAWPTAPAT